MTRNDSAKKDEPVRDASGRIVAPAQPTIEYMRPAGPWDANARS